jgi:hypothetical protein
MATEAFGSGGRDDAQRWERVIALCHAAIGRPSSERAAFSAAQCGGDEALRAEVESLLAAHDVNPASVLPVLVARRPVATIRRRDFAIADLSSTPTSRGRR